LDLEKGEGEEVNSICYYVMIIVHKVFFCNLILHFQKTDLSTR